MANRYNITTDGTDLKYNDGTGEADLSVGGGAEYAMITSTIINTLSSGGAVFFNVEQYDTGNFISLSSQQFTLLEGTYIVSGAYLTYDSAKDWGYIYNVSDSVVEYYGSLAYSDTSDPSISPSLMNGKIVVPSGGKTYEMRSGGGRAGTSELNTTGDQLTFIKIA